MRIVAARVEPLRLVLRRPLVTASGAVSERCGFLLHVATDGGLVAVGEASPAYWIGEGSLAETAEHLALVAARLRTRPSLDEVRGWLDEGDADGLGAAAAAALDAALLELAARARGVAVTTLLGGSEGTAVPIAALVGGPSPAAAADEAALAVARGFRTIKLKVGGGGLADDLARVAAVRTRVGTGVDLRLDANRAWTSAEAARALAALAPFGVAYVEEPLRDAFPARLAALARATGVPLAVDESVRGRGDLEALIAAGARVHVVLKAARVGGATRLVALARRAHAAGLSVVVTDAIESRVGMAVAVHAAAALAEPRAAVGLGGAQLALAAAGCAEPVLVPCGPGGALVAPSPCRSAAVPASAARPVARGVPSA